MKTCTALGNSTFEVPGKYLPFVSLVNLVSFIIYSIFTFLQCEPLNGFGFRRGGYQCVCRPGYYYPWWHDGPFLGLEIEEATNDEYAIGFDCIPVEGN